MLTADELQALRDGLANATPGGWRLVPYDSRFLVIGHSQPWPPVASVERREDAAFIVQVRQHLGAFLLIEQSLWEIVRAVAAVEPIICHDDAMHCLYDCGGHVEANAEGTAYFAHASGCAYVKALELTSDVGHESCEPR